MIRREVSQVESDALLKIVNPFKNIEIGDASSATYWLLSDWFRKFAHIVEYSILGYEMMIYRTLKKENVANRDQFINLMFIGIFVGLVDETIQFFSSRGSLVTDVWIDTFGVFLGLAIGRFISKKFLI